jgi:hypothetical protein
LTNREPFLGLPVYLRTLYAAEQWLTGIAFCRLMTHTRSPVTATRPEAVPVLKNRIADWPSSWKAAADGGEVGHT